MSMSTNEGNVTNVTVDLIFTGAYREDTGVYECSAINLLNYVTRSTNLIVQCTYAYVCYNIYKSYIRSPDNLMIEILVGVRGPQPLFKGCLYVEFMNIYIRTGFISFSLLS